MNEKHTFDYYKICDLIGKLGFIHYKITYDNKSLGASVNEWQATIQQLIDELHNTRGSICYYYHVEQLQKHYTYINSDVTWACIKKNIVQYTLDISGALCVLTNALHGNISPRSQRKVKYLKQNPSTWFIN